MQCNGRADKTPFEPEEMWHALVENTFNFVMVIDRDGTILFINRTSAVTTVEDTIGTSIYDYIEPAYHDVAKKTIEKTFQVGQPGNYQAKVGYQGYYLLWYDTQVMPIKRDGQIVAAILIAANITQRKKAEIKLEETEAWWRSLTENSPDQIMLLDLDGRILFINYTVPGLTKKQVIGKPVNDVIPPEFHQVAADCHRRVLETGKPASYDIEYHTKNGEIQYYEVRIAPVFQDGKITGLMSSSTNITQRKKVEIKLEETLEELKQTHQQIIQQERLRALGQMASGIAHDFNNTLTPMLAYTYLLLDDTASFDAKEAKKFIQAIRTAAKDAAGIVGRLRDFYRHCGKEIFKLVRLNELVKQTVELTEPKWKGQAQANGATIDIKLDLEEVPYINGNEVELREVLTNLILNAVDAISTNETTSGTITICIHQDGDYVVLKISDTGEGMTKEVKEHCLEPFFSTKDAQGTGLGLSMVYSIIQRHEGSLEIDTTPGKGSTFTIYLPIQIEQQKEEQLEEIETDLSPIHVLVVDDEPTTIDIVTRYLALDGHTAESALNGREGLDKFRAGRFDLVITDQAMPKMSGNQLAVDIKQIAPETPVLLLTGFGLIRDMQSFVEDGVVDYLLSKPVDPDVFRRALAKVMTIAS